MDSNGNKLIRGVHLFIAQEDAKIITTIVTTIVVQSSCRRYSSVSNYYHSFLEKLSVFTVNQNKNIRMAGLNRSTGETTDHKHSLSQSTVEKHSIFHIFSRTEMIRTIFLQAKVLRNSLKTVYV